MWGVIYSHFLLLGPCAGLLSDADICLWPRVQLEFNFGWGFIPMVVKESCTELLLDDRGSILGVARELAFCYHFWAPVPTQRSVQCLPGTIFLGVEAVGAWMWTTHVLPKSGIWVCFGVCPLSAFVGRWISQVELCACYSESYWINSPTLFIK